MIIDGLFATAMAHYEPGSVRIEVTAMIAERDQVVLQWTSRARTPGGRSYENGCIGVFTIEDGQIQDVREYMDTLYARDVVFGAGGDYVQPSSADTSAAVSSMSAASRCHPASFSVSRCNAFTRASIHSLFSEIREAEGKTVLLVTHDLAEAILLADQIAVMGTRPGRIKQVYKVPFPRPRHLMELQGAREFGSLYTQLWNDLRVEIVPDVDDLPHG